MKATRDTALQQILQQAEAAFHAAASSVPPASPPLAERVFRAMDVAPSRSATGSCNGNAGQFPACACWPEALNQARAVGGPVAGMADALDALSPSLTWQRRPGAETGPEGFYNGHANTVLFGPRGLEPRADVLVGISLIAPNIRYPDHHHPPEEFYVVMSRGEWRQNEGPWHEPGAGGVVHNPPGILHAMRSGDAPLLAAWFLWTG